MNLTPSPGPFAPPAISVKRFMGFTPVVWAWAFYDMANTVFYALFVSLSLPFYIDKMGGDERIVGLTSSGAYLIAALLVPFLGTISDQIGRRLPFVLASTIACCLLTPAVAYLPLSLAVVCAAVAIFAYDVGIALYDPILSDIAAPEEQGRASGLGTGIGYAGTIFALACAYPIMQALGMESVDSLRAIGWLVGGLFFALAVPLFWVHRERATEGRAHPLQAARESFARVAEGARLASPELWRFVAASFFFVNAAMAVITFFGLYARKELGMPMEQFVKVYALLSLSAGAGSILLGIIADTIGARRTLMICGAIWIGLLVFMLQRLDVRGFMIAGAIGGIALGGVWTTIRPILISMANAGRMGESFGFLGVANRASSIVGPALFGFLAAKRGYPTAIAALIVFFVIGMAILATVPEKRPKSG